MTFDEARAQFPVLERYAYLNAGTNGPLARATVEALTAQAERELQEGRSGRPQFDALLEARETARNGLAAVIGVDPALVALVDSTTRGCGTVMTGLGLGPGGRDRYHRPGALRSRRPGARVRRARSSSRPRTRTAILAAVTPRTRLLALSHVLWTTGRRLDLAHLKEASGLPLLVDGAQSAGAIEVDATPFDFYTVSAQKWLCGPDPTGALYVRDPERLRIVAPSYLSQSAYEISGAFTPKDGAARFDSGWIGFPILAGLVAALGTHPEWRYERAADTAARCRELLAEHVEVLTPPGHSTLVTFRPPGDPTELVAQLFERGVVVRELPGRNMVRASCGWWTSEDDLRRLVAGLGGH